MLNHLKTCVVIFFALTLITGVLYPAAVTGVARITFPHQAQGSLLRENGEIRGSCFIAQKFTSPAYFFPRPSASDYGTMPSGASNLGPTSSDLMKIVDRREKEFFGFYKGKVPPEMLFASGSGLDPHISPENALAQIDHVAAARGLSLSEKAQLVRLVREHVEGPQFGVFGSPRVNVLILNVELDKLFGAPQ